MKVLQIHFVDDFGHSCCAAETGTHSANFKVWVQFLGKVVDILIVTQRLIPMVQSVNKTMTMGIPQLQYFDKVVDVPGVRVLQVSQVQVVVETVMLPQLQLVEKSL